MYVYSYMLNYMTAFAEIIGTLAMLYLQYTPWLTEYFMVVFCEV